eukprot:Skav216381  [mRNA]  locus=scaffold1241:58653:59177:+ [translate_table: standard]
MKWMCWISLHQRLHSGWVTVVLCSQELSQIPCDEVDVVDFLASTAILQQCGAFFVCTARMKCRTSAGLPLSFAARSCRRIPVMKWMCWISLHQRLHSGWVTVVLCSQELSKDPCDEVDVLDFLASTAILQQCGTFFVCTARMKCRTAAGLPLSFAARSCRRIAGNFLVPSLSGT